MNGYVAITNTEWCQYIRLSHLNEAVFWRKKNTFKALKDGELFYFLSRTNPTEASSRQIVGRASFKGCNILPAKEAWLAYGTQLGFATRTAFAESVMQLYKSPDVHLGCILLEQIQFLSSPITLQECGVEFSPYIVSGRTIDLHECERINYYFSKER